MLLSAGCVRGPRRPGTRAAGCWHSLAWLWTRLASASLQPPTPTGLEEVVGPTPGGMWFSKMPGKLDTNHPTLFHSRQMSEAE